MTTRPDREDEMLTVAHDLDLADRILSGALQPPDLDAPYRRVAELVEAARATTAHQIAPGDASSIAAITALIREGSAPVLPATRRARLGRRAGAAVVVAVVLGSAGAAAAATDHLPSAVQSFVSNAASHVGIDVPSPDDDAASTDGGSSVDTTNGPPTSQPGASAGADGVDQRPDCAGNPSSTTPGCGAENQSSNATEHSDEAPPTTVHENPGNPDPGTPPTTVHSDSSSGVGTEQSHAPNSNAQAN
jgi:hypothetical protein